MSQANPHEVARARTCLIFFILGMICMAIIDEAAAAEYYDFEPRSRGYEFKVSPTCPNYVRFQAEIAASKFSTFVPTSVTGESSKEVGYDGVNIITCAPIEQLTNALRFDCWDDRGMYACSDYVVSETSGAIVGQATWWRENAESVELLECDVEIDPEADFLQRVAIHEIGHCHGLRHSPYYEAVMYAKVFLPNGFHFDDIIGLCHLYGCDKDIADDFGRIVINEIVIPGQTEVWTGVVTVDRVVTASQVP